MLLNNLKLRVGSKVSFVGAGGKTSLIFRLAQELSCFGFSVLVTTTTSIFHPSYVGFKYDHIIIGDVSTYKKKYNIYKGRIYVAGSSYNIKTMKLAGYNTKYIDNLNISVLFDFIFIEADGAKMKPIKAPAAYEPVVPKISNLVIGCVGLDSIGNCINEFNVHRAEVFLSILNDNIRDPIISEKHIISLIISDFGLFKDIDVKTDKIVFLNKADNLILIKKGINIAVIIKKNCPNIKFAIVGCLKDKANTIKFIL